MSIQTPVQPPPVQDFTLPGRDDQELRLRGRQLGFATSRRDLHSGHMPTFAGVSDDEIIAIADEFEERRTQLTARGVARTDPLYVALTRYISDLYDEDIDAATLSRYAAPGDRCSACRWFEVRILSVEAEFIDGQEQPPRATYLVLTYGLSDVPGEVAKRRATWTNSPYTVLETLTQRRGASAFLPATSARVLSEAAAVDAGIAGAYINRAVA